jgi:hypothetical protein
MSHEADEQHRHRKDGKARGTKKPAAADAGTEPAPVEVSVPAKTKKKAAEKVLQPAEPAHEAKADPKGATKKKSRSKKATQPEAATEPPPSEPESPVAEPEEAEVVAAHPAEEAEEADVVAVPAPAEEDEGETEPAPEAVPLPRRLPRMPAVEESPLLLELFVTQGAKMKVIFDMIYNLMMPTTYLIFSLTEIYYSDVNEAGTIVMQFRVIGAKAGRYQPPVEVKSASECKIISFSSKDMQSSSKAKALEHLRLYVQKTKRKVLKVEISGPAMVTPTENGVALGDDSAFHPIDTPKYPESLTPIVHVPGKEFGEKMKTLKDFGKTAKVLVQKAGVKMVAGTEETLFTSPVFGLWKEGEPLIFEGTFPCTDLAQIAKCGPNSEEVRIYAMPNKPLKIVADIGRIGEQYIHLYNKKPS